MENGPGALALGAVRRPRIQLRFRPAVRGGDQVGQIEAEELTVIARLVLRQVPSASVTVR